MASDSFQYRALFEYKQERGDDISLQPGDLLTVSKAALTATAGPDYQDGDERSPKGWLHGTNESTKENGVFPGTFVEYVGAARAGHPAAKSWSRLVPPTPGGPQPAGAAAVAEAELCALRDRAPVAVRRLAEAIEKHGSGAESLYQASPVSGGPADLRRALDSDPVSVDLDQYDVGTLTDALKGFLQDLPGTIIPTTVYSELIRAGQETQSVEDYGERLNRILEDPSVPQANHQVLVHLSRHLARVSLQNQSTSRLLGQIFAELVFKNPFLSTDVSPEHHVRILEALITTGGLTEMQAAPGENSTVQEQPPDVDSALWSRIGKNQSDLSADDDIRLADAIGESGLSRTHIHLQP